MKNNINHLLQPARKEATRSTPSAATDTAFVKEVQEGLSADPKHLSSKYFYDKTGDKLFQAIMDMPEYYLTRTEYAILEKHKEELLALFSANSNSFNLVEFGAGDGLKTKVLLKHFAAQDALFRYIPIDISGHVLEVLANDLNQHLPAVKVTPLQGEYFQALKRLSRTSESRNVVLFLGSNIGNFTEKQAIHFLKAIGNNLSTGDLALVGFDLKKEPHLIAKAYNDGAGITRAFNLNLLARINRELGADFDLDSFEHYPIYDPESGEARSYIISKKAQQVYIESLQQVFHFKAWETIHTEISRKYDTATIQKYAASAGFAVKEFFYDEQQYYVNALFEKE